MVGWGASQCTLRPAFRVRVVFRRVKAEFFDPDFEDSGVLTCSKCPDVP